MLDIIVISIIMAVTIQPRRGEKSVKGKQRERSEEEEKMPGDVSPQRKGIISRHQGSEKQFQK